MHASACSGSLNATDATPSGCLCSTNTCQLFTDATNNYETARMTLNSHQRGWPSWPPRTSHTLCADPRDTRSTPVGLPTTANTETMEINTLNGQDSVYERVCVSLCTSKSLGWNMFLMMTTFSCLFLKSPCFSGLQSNCLHRQRHTKKGNTQLHFVFSLHFSTFWGVFVPTCRLTLVGGLNKKETRKSSLLLLLLHLLPIIFVLLLLLAGVILAL